MIIGMVCDGFYQIYPSNNHMHKHICKLVSIIFFDVRN